MTLLAHRLASFLAPGTSPKGIDLCLPEFSGSLSAPLRMGGLQGPYGYPSTAFSNRDVKSAFYVQSLLSRHFDEGSIRVQSPGDFVSARKHGARRVGILFGSRSNRAFWPAGEFGQLSRLVSFQFGTEWAIVGADQRRFSIPDPSKLSREAYEAKTDYCVVARVRGDQARPLFLIAGLGGRATEGGGRYLAYEWQKLHRKFETRDFAVVLSFPPPVSPDRFSVAARYVAPSDSQRVRSRVAHGR